MGCNCGGQTNKVRSYKRSSSTTAAVPNMLVQQSQQFLLFIAPFPNQPLTFTGDATGHVYEFTELQRLRAVFLSDIAALMPTGQFVRLAQSGGVIAEFDGKLYRIQPQDLPLLT